MDYAAAVLARFSQSFIVDFDTICDLCRPEAFPLALVAQRSKERLTTNGEFARRY
jgi:hypothetical protein